MKRLLFSLMLLTAFLGNVWAESKLYFEQETITIPNSASPANEVEYHQSLKWLWDTNNPNDVYTIQESQESDFSWTVHTTGDITITGDNIRWSKDNGDYGKEYNLSSGKFKYSGNNGSITVTAINPDFGGVTYSATYTILFRIQVKKWDFNSKQYTIQGSWDGNASLMNSHPERTSPEYHKRYNPNGYDWDGSGLVSEAAGLQFKIPADNNGFTYFGGNNPSGTVPVENRFICLYNGASFTIPISYFANCTNPRIRIKTDRYGGPDANTSLVGLEITNGKDALGKVINSEYQIGGSDWWGSKGDNNFRGEYHFQLQDPANDFTVKITSGQWLMLLSIEVYDSKDMITENSVLGTGYQLLNKFGTIGSNGAQGTYNLHYWGRGERTALTTHHTANNDWYYWPIGTVTCTNNSFTCSDNLLYWTYTSKVGEVGNFNIRIELQTRDGKYCTDYATRSMSVGYLNKKEYPYTWDFTDVFKYKDGAGRMGGNSGNDPFGEGDYSYYNRWEKRYLWEDINKDGTLYGHRLAREAGNYNALFCAGSQLWYGKTIIPELEGLGFTPSNIDGSYNNSLQILPEGGIKIHQAIRDWWVYRIAIPQVPSNGAVYVRVHPDVEVTNRYYHAGYSYGDYRKTVTNKNGVVTDPGNLEIPFSDESDNNVSVTVNTTDGTGDVIYVIPGSAKSASENITLYFNDVTIKKIAVSLDPKTVNIKGWASESRGRVIDPELTGYMTGSNLQTFIVDQQTYGDNVVITRIDNIIDNIDKKALVMDAVPSVNGQYTDNNAACLIYNNDPNYVDEEEPDETKIESNKVEIINGGFHLFVPDMHDYGTSDAKKKLVSTKFPNNQLKSAIVKNSDVPASADGKTNYALSYRAYHETTNEPIVGKEGFYRIQNTGIKSNGNQAYLPIANSPSILMYNLAFDGDGADTNAIDNRLINSHHSENNVYYNMNGQKIKGIPTTRGLYIVNGKKVIIK